MTDQERYAILGKARLDYAQAKKDLAALKSKAATLAEIARKVANGLEDPKNLRFLESGLQMSQARSNPGIVLVAASDFESLTYAEIRQLHSEITRTEANVETLRQQLTQLEGEDPDPRRLGLYSR
ncbi:MAG: hypothetical protein NVSMB58_16400 [Terriglobales bacterium]